MALCPPSNPVVALAARLISRVLLSGWIFLGCWAQIVLAPTAVAQSTWPRFRGERGDGHVASFPQGTIQPKLLWETPLPSQGVGGVSATDEFVIVSSRSADDQQDLFVCLDPVSGAVLWQKEYAAPGQLDYGTSPRATALINDPYVVVLGAMGDLHCLDIDSGEVKWHVHLVKDLGGVLPIWGYGWSPLLVDDRLIVMPGGPACSIAALAPESGKVIWQTAGQPTAYASPVLAQWNDRKQIVTYDRVSLGGWALQDGKRLWSIKPAEPNDFNVPTPLIQPDALIVVTENNGLRKYDIDPQTGFPKPEPAARLATIKPDAHTPVICGRQLIAAERELIAVNLDKQLAIDWRIKDRALRQHNSLIASGNQVLVITQGGELLLVQSDGMAGKIVARHKFTGETKYILSHPALVGDTLYLRAENSLQAWSLWESSQSRP